MLSSCSLCILCASSVCYLVVMSVCCQCLLCVLRVCCRRVVLVGLNVYVDSLLTDYFQQIVDTCGAFTKIYQLRPSAHTYKYISAYKIIRLLSYGPSQ